MLKLFTSLLSLMQIVGATVTVTVTQCPTSTVLPTSVVDSYQKDCLRYVNNFRKRMNVTPLKTRKSKINCSNKEALLNFKSNKFHTKFGMCDENGQCECKGFTNVKDCIDAYISEGPGGGHYELLRSSEFTHLTCGIYKMPSGGYYYTHNFYIVSKKPTSTPRPTTSTPRPTSTPPQPTTTSAPQDNTYTSRCLKLVNDFRASLGLQLLVQATSQQIQCANNSAKNDLLRGYHNSFGQCSERGQCECNGYRSIDQCIAAYISEGPGGGHYEILKGRYTSLACGIDGNTFYTHNFY